MWDEFLPEVGGRVLVPGHADLDGRGLAVEDPATDAGLAELVVPEVLLADGGAPGEEDLYLADAGLRYEHMIDRMVRGLPVIRGGRTVTPLEGLPPEE